jgi:hypothetical protein
MALMRMCRIKGMLADVVTPLFIHYTSYFRNYPGRFLPNHWVRLQHRMRGVLRRYCSEVYAVCGSDAVANQGIAPIVSRETLTQADDALHPTQS